MSEISVQITSPCFFVICGMKKSVILVLCLLCIALSHIAHSQNGTMSFVDSALDAMDNIQPDPYAKGRTYSYSPSQYNFERYQKSPCYDKLGFSPYRDQAKQESDYCDCEDKYYRSLAWKIGITVAILAVLAFFIIKYYKRKTQERASVNPENYDSPTTNKKTKDAGSTNPNTWLHPIGETTTGETLVDSKTNTPSAEKANLSKFQELDNKLNQLEELLRSGILTEFEFEEKSKTVKFDFRSSIAAKKIGAIKEGQIKQVQSAVASGILSEAEAHIKIKLIEDAVVCPYCENMSASALEYCSKCGLDESGKRLNEGTLYFCTHCNTTSTYQFITCPNCGKQGLGQSERQNAVSEIIYGGSFILLVIIILLFLLELDK